MILFPTDLLAAALDDLPPEIRSILEAYFFNGESTFKIQRHTQMKHRDVETAIETGLSIMRAVLKDLGITTMADLC